MLQIVIVDGGSRDKTLQVAREHCVDKVILNPFLTEEYGRCIGVKEATGELVAFLDADNYLPQSNWLARMVEPFADQRIIASEPLYYTSDKTDPAIVRYCSLVGSDDPVYTFLGYFDRYCTFSNMWTKVPIVTHDEGNYLHFSIVNPLKIPTMGANGFVIRKRWIELMPATCFVHTDMIYKLVSLGLNDFAKVKIGVKHFHASSITSYVQKKMRRARRYDFSPRLYNQISLVSFARFALASSILVPLARESVRGYKRTPDIAWLLHIALPFIVLMIYGLEFAKKKATSFV